MRILVVEDEKTINDILCKTLEAEGYGVAACFNGEEALTYALGAEYDIIVMDILMPKMDGFTAVEHIRSKGIAAPILFLSARSAVEDKIKALSIGGDYYLTKPFQVSELLAVIRAMLRKYAPDKTDILTISDLTVNVAQKTVLRGGKTIELTVKEFALLEYMLRNRDVVLSRSMIENSLWNYDYEGGTNVVDVYVGYLRKKIDRGFDKKLIHTVWGVGWRLSEK